MPITKRQFELRINNDIQRWMQEVYKFLSSHQDLAYNDVELLRTWPGVDADASEREIFLDALDALVRVGAAESEMVGQQRYFSYASDLDPETWDGAIDGHLGPER